MLLRKFYLQVLRALRTHHVVLGILVVLVDLGNQMVHGVLGFQPNRQQ